MAGTISPWCWLTTRLRIDTDLQCIQDDSEIALDSLDLPGLLITGFAATARYVMRYKLHTPLLPVVEGTAQAMVEML